MDTRHRPLSPAMKRMLFVALWLVCVIIGSIFVSRYSSGGRDLTTTMDSLASHKRSHRQKTPSYYASEPMTLHLEEFDPNEADSTQLLSLGLTPFQVRAIYRFRSKGYRYHSADDFRRVPDLTREQWERISPYIRIDARYQLVEQVPRQYHRPYPKAEVTTDTGLSAHSTSSTGTFRSAKIGAGETININSADSATLCRIPGIGPYFAKQLIRYRKQLGGFHSVSQLLDMDDFPEEPLQYMRVDDVDRIAKIDINTLTKRQLMRHPYIRFYKADDIITFRNRHGPFTSIDQLRHLPHFTDEEVDRLSPYIRL